MSESYLCNLHSDSSCERLARIHLYQLEIENSSKCEKILLSQALPTYVRSNAVFGLKFTKFHVAVHCRGLVSGRKSSALFPAVHGRRQVVGQQLKGVPLVLDIALRKFGLATLQSNWSCRKRHWISIPLPIGELEDHTDRETDGESHIIVSVAIKLNMFAALGWRISPFGDYTQTDFCNETNTDL